MKKGIKVDDWLDRKAAAEYIGLTDWWLAKHAHTDKGPRYIQHGRKVWYRRDDLDAFLAENKNVTQYGAGGTNALDNLWTLSTNRTQQKPPSKVLEAEYRAEHGEPEPPSRKVRWKKFCETLTAAQRAMLKEVQAAQ